MSELSLQGFIDECEREPLHHIQSIQPHGALLAGVSGDPQVRWVSANLEDWLGCAPQQALGQSLAALLPDCPLFEQDTEWTRAQEDKQLLPALVTGPQGALDALLSGHAQHWLLELELAKPEIRHEAQRPVPHRLYRLPSSAEEWEQQCHFLTEELRGCTGFDRVMLYRFRPDGCGEVIAESLEHGLAPYLGLRYPASDIPQIARTLYLENRHRQIPDIQAQPVPIIGEDAALLDLTRSDLRAVSPVHIHYLANMGVTASLSFSLILSGRLWGLIACHCATARLVPLPLRERCSEMAKVFTLAIAGYKNYERLLEVSNSDHDIALLVETLHSAEAEHSHDSARALGRSLLSLVNARGAALIDDDTIVTFGVTPAKTELRALADWIRQHNSEHIFMSDALPEHYPPAQHYRDCASGVLAVQVNRFDARGDRLFMWLRPEQPQTVYWAGDPRKSTLFDEQSQSLSPRSSFEQWIETTSGHSEPWTDADRLRALKFRSLVLRDVSF